MESDTVTLCVGGSVFVTNEEVLKRYPDTLLASLSTSSSSYDRTNGWHFFDRDDDAFKSILNLYRTAELHVPSNLCSRAFGRELEFWKVPSDMVSKCCWRTMYRIERDLTLLSMLSQTSRSDDVIVNSETSNYAKWRSRMWTFFEEPNSSRGAKVFNLLVMLVLVTSALVACLLTVPELRDELEVNPNDPTLGPVEQQQLLVLQQTIANISNDKLRMLLYSSPKRGLYATDFLCVVIFFVELVIRWSVCPFKELFFKKVIIWVDIITVLTGFSIYLYEVAYYNEWVVHTETSFYPYFFLRTLYVIRLFRFSRLSERFIELKIMMLSIKQSSRQLILLMIAYLILATIFGSVEYYCEFENNHFSNIPLAIWWAIVSMTTVGYGDYVPTDVCGYVVGSMCSLCGLLIIAMPIAVIASNFHSLFSLNLSMKHHKCKDSSSLTKKQPLLLKW